MNLLVVVVSRRVVEVNVVGRDGWRILHNRPWFRFFSTDLGSDPELKEKPKLKNQKLKRLKGSPFFRFNDGFNGSTVQWWSQWFNGSNVQWFNDGLTPLPAQWWFPHPEPGPLHHCHFQPEYLRKSDNHLHHHQYHLYHWKWKDSTDIILIN